MPRVLTKPLFGVVNQWVGFGAKQSGGLPNWVHNTLGAASANNGYLHAGYLNDAKQKYKYAQRINGKVRSASTITRVNRISSFSTARGLSRSGGGLTFLAAGASVYDGLIGEAGWQNHHTADLLVTGAIYGKIRPKSTAHEQGFTLKGGTEVKRLTEDIIQLKVYNKLKTKSSHHEFCSAYNLKSGRYSIKVKYSGSFGNIETESIPLVVN